jgi:hypothetical protein
MPARYHAHNGDSLGGFEWAACALPAATVLYRTERRRRHSTPAQPAQPRLLSARQRVPSQAFGEARRGCFGVPARPAKAALCEAARRGAARLLQHPSPPSQGGLRRGTARLAERRVRTVRYSTDPDTRRGLGAPLADCVPRLAELGAASRAPRAGPQARGQPVRVPGEAASGRTGGHVGGGRNGGATGRAGERALRLLTVSEVPGGTVLYYWIAD